MSDSVIKVEGVSKKYCRSLRHTMLYGAADLSRSFLGLNQCTEELRDGEFWALDNVNFEIKRGETLGLIGANGSGKSTLLKMLNGIFMPDKGKIEVDGRVGALIEVGAGFHPMLTGRENVYVNGAILGMAKDEIDNKFDKIVDFADIGDFIDSPVKHYSSGMYVRLGFSIAAHAEPDILLIDEVLAVGDARFQRKCFAKIEEFRNDGKTIILVSHAMDSINLVCDQVVLIDKGELLEQGPSRYVTNIYRKILFGGEVECEEVPIERVTNTIEEKRNLSVELAHKSKRGETETSDDERLKQLALKMLNTPGSDKKAEVIDFGILDKHGERVTHLETGEEYTIFSRSLFYEDVASAELGCRITNAKGIDFFMTNTFVHKISVPPQKRGCILEAQFHVKMWFASGNFFLTLGVGENDDNIYDIRMDVMQFEVSGNDKVHPGSLINLNEKIVVKNLEVFD